MICRIILHLRGESFVFKCYKYAVDDPDTFMLDFDYKEIYLE